MPPFNVIRKCVVNSMDLVTTLQLVITGILGAISVQ
uniref:Uncharacterized protein n=1 Tax=Anguilla anguilla TaxID=7936 RepID=A0A0E9S851_ANGAN